MGQRLGKSKKREEGKAKLRVGKNNPRNVGSTVSLNEAGSGGGVNTSPNAYVKNAPPAGNNSRSRTMPRPAADAAPTTGTTPYRWSPSAPYLEFYHLTLNVAAHSAHKVTVAVYQTLTHVLINYAEFKWLLWGRGAGALYYFLGVCSSGSIVGGAMVSTCQDPRRMELL